MRQCTQNLINQHLMDINPILAGWATDWNCAPQWEPQRHHMLLYYVKKGSFTLIRKNASYQVRPGQIFFVSFDDRITHTKEDEPKQTYDFSWIGFTGALSHRFGQILPPLEIRNDQLTHFKNLMRISPYNAYDLAADLLLLRSSLLDSHEPKPDYVQHIVDYIQQSYMLPLTVEGLAAQVGLDRSYLSRLFKQRTGTTLRDHLQYVRIHQAKQLLAQGYSVKESAYRCGFRDDKRFHKVFLQHEGITPNMWKKCMIEHLSNIHSK